MYHPVLENMFLQKTVCFDMCRIVNHCPNSILDKRNTHSHQDFSGCIKENLLAFVPGKLHYSGLLCMQELNLISHNFYLMSGIFCLCISRQNNILFNHLLLYVGIK